MEHSRERERETEAVPVLRGGAGVRGARGAGDPGEANPSALGAPVREVHPRRHGGAEGRPRGVEQESE